MDLGTSIGLISVAISGNVACNLMKNSILAKLNNAAIDLLDGGV